MLCFLDDVNEPYLCTILINKISYGQAGSANKKQARQLAGTFCILLLVSQILIDVLLACTMCFIDMSFL